MVVVERTLLNQIVSAVARKLRVWVSLKLVIQLKALKIEFEQEFKFHPKRKWRADFHLVEKMILVEVEGGIWSGGRHTRGKGYLGDMEKYNAATVMGYRVIRFSTEQVKSGLAIEQIEGVIKG